MNKVLVIDDETEVREMVRLALQQRGFDVIEADNGAKGLELARTELPDLVLCDVNMQGVDGYHTLSSLRDDPTTASTPFIFITGVADNAGMRYGMELGADDYLPKPFSLATLYAAVESRLKKAQTLRQEAEKKLTSLRDNISLMLPHELRTPLNGIIAYGEILASDAATIPTAEISEMGQGIYDSGKRLEKLIENFLIYAQIELLGVDPQKVSLLRQKRTEHPAPLLERHARAQAQLARREPDLVLDLVDQPVPVSEDYLTKIATELVQNAFKFSKPGTRVQVTLASFPDAISLTVTDHGRGLSPEQITQVGAYMQFDRKLQEQQGLGLGLAIVKRLTELHGGTLRIQSQNDVGTTVVIKIPHTAK